jgi:hypothetical protein
MMDSQDIKTPNDKRQIIRPDPIATADTNNSLRFERSALPCIVVLPLMNVVKCKTNMEHK